MKPHTTYGVVNGAIWTDLEKELNRVVTEIAEKHNVHEERVAKILLDRIAAIRLSEELK